MDILHMYVLIIPVQSSLDVTYAQDFGLIWISDSLVVCLQDILFMYLLIYILISIF